MNGLCWLYDIRRLMLSSMRRRRRWLIDANFGRLPAIKLIKSWTKWIKSSKYGPSRLLLSVFTFLWADGLLVSVVCIGSGILRWPYLDCPQPDNLVIVRLPARVSGKMWIDTTIPLISCSCYLSPFHLVTSPPTLSAIHISAIRNGSMHQEMYKKLFGTCTSHKSPESKKLTS